MATYETRVEEFTGLTTDTGFITNWCTDVAREIIAALPAEYLEFMSETKIDTDGAAGIALNNCRILYADKAGIMAVQKPAAMRAKFILATSIHLATNSSPIYYKLADKAYVLPGGGNIHVIEFPVIAFGDDYGSYASTDKVPEEIEPLIVYGVSMRFILKTMRELREALPTMPAISSADLVLLGVTLGAGVTIAEPLQKAQYFIDAGATLEGDSAAAALSVQTSIAGDDFTKARASIEAARQELERANTIIKSVQLADNPALSKIKVLLENYTTHVSSYLQQHDKLVGTYGMLYKLYREGLDNLIGKQDQR